MAENKYLLEMTCGKCGASISLDIDNLIAYCPYCGNKLMVDPIAFRDLLVEREKTKRLEMEFTHEKEMEDSASNRKTMKNKALLIAAAIGLVCLVAGFALEDSSLGGGLLLGGMCLLSGVAYVWLFSVTSEEKRKKEQSRQELVDKLTGRR